MLPSALIVLPRTLTPSPSASPSRSRSLTRPHHHPTTPPPANPRATVVLGMVLGPADQPLVAGAAPLSIPVHSSGWPIDAIATVAVGRYYHDTLLPRWIRRVRRKAQWRGPLFIGCTNCRYAAPCRTVLRRVAPRAAPSPRPIAGLPNAVSLSHTHATSRCAAILPPSSAR